MKFFKRFLSVLLTVTIISVPIIVWIQRQEIYDWYRLRDYTPPASIVTLADETTMTPYARKVFYVTQPVIADQQTFNAACSREASIVLGCYIPGEGIYLYDIKDARLHGVMEVTAAHEMLHAAYDRLDGDEQRRVDDLTAANLKNVTDQRVLDTVERYREHDPSVVPNELHSILATEVSQLSPELEDYYKQYFTNRQAVIAYSKKYEAEFSTRQAKVAEYDGQLADMKQQIEANKTELNLQYKALTAEQSRLNDLRSSGDIASYNSAVPGFNQSVADYRRLVSETDSTINRYNSIVATRNDLAVEVQDLAEAIDSNTPTL